MRDPLNVFWTSGWDSTYRVADLVLNQGQEVQPWYVIDSLRRSTKTELQTMDRIRNVLIQKNSATADLLHQPKLFHIEDIPSDTEISTAFSNLTSTGHLGSQYDWLARLAKSEGLSLELSIHRDDTAHAFLEGHTELDTYGVHRLKDDAPKDLGIFQHFTFPLFDLSKLDMQRHAQGGSFDDVMEMTWFCFIPLFDGRPCGYCNPCKYTRDEGLGRRVPPQTPLRQAQYSLLLNLTRARSLLRRKLVIGK